MARQIFPHTMQVKPRHLHNITSLTRRITQRLKIPRFIEVRLENANLPILTKYFLAISI